MIKLSRASMPGSFFRRSTVGIRKSLLQSNGRTSSRDSEIPPTVERKTSVGIRESEIPPTVERKRARLGNLASNGRTPYLFRTYG